MRKLLMIAFLLCFSTVGFAEEYKGELVDVRSMHTTVLSGLLYETDGGDVHGGYKKLNGYPGQDQFQIYFKEDRKALAVFADQLNVNLEERIEWVYKGATQNNSRYEIYTLLNDLHHSRTNEGSREWMRKTFGQVYLDWIQRNLITEDAIRLVTKYKDFVTGVKPFDRFSTAKIKVDTRQTNNNTDLDGIK